MLHKKKWEGKPYQQYIILIRNILFPPFPPLDMKDFGGLQIVQRLFIVLTMNL